MRTYDPNTAQNDLRINAKLPLRWYRPPGFLRFQNEKSKNIFENNVGNYFLMHFESFRTILDRFRTSRNHESEMSSRPLEKYQWWWYFISQRSSLNSGKKWKSWIFGILTLDDLGWCLWTLYVWSGDMICGLETWYVVWRHDMWSWDMIYVVLRHDICLLDV